MKKIYSLSLLLVAGLSFGQTPIMTGIMDGDCLGGNPKAVEIYANGTVDFALYSIESQTNANTTWGNTLSLAPLGIVTNQFVYVIAADANSAFDSEFDGIPTARKLVAPSSNSPVAINGDDRVRIVLAATSVVIDQYGQEGVDGTQTAWDYIDSWAKRVNGTGPDGANFNISNWAYGGVTYVGETFTGSLDGLGSCNGGADYSTVVPFGQYTPPTGGVKDNSIAGLSIYPNPLSGNVLNITSASTAVKTVAVYDVLGKNVINAKVTNGTVNVAGLNSGVYIVKVTEEGKTATRKLVIK